MTHTRSFMSVLLIALVVLAGCTGGPSGDGGDGGAADTTTPTPTAEPTDTQSDGSGDGDAPTWEPFEFDEEGRYVYDIYLVDEGEGRLVWDVQEVSGDEVTVAIEYELGETTYSSTTTGTREDIQGRLIMTPAAPFMVLTIFSPVAGYYAGEPLRVGNQWSYSTAEGSASLAVTGTTTYAGLTCYTTEMRQDGELRHEGCYAPDIGLAAHSAFYDDGEVLQVEMTLVEYSR